MIEFRKPPLPFTITLSILLLLQGCSGCGGADEIVKVNSSIFEAGYLIDGANVNGEFVDSTIVTRDDIFEFSTDLIARTDGQAEVAAFTRSRSPFVASGYQWNAGYDVVGIPFPDAYVLDFTVWVVDVDLLNPVNNRVNETLDALAYAQAIWEIEGMGITVGNVTVTDATGFAGVNALRDCSSCFDSPYFSNLTTTVGFTPGEINIYLTRKVFDSRQFGVVNLISGDKIALGMWTGEEDLLVHEIGHLFSLLHTEEPLDPNQRDFDLNDFDLENVATGVAPGSNKRRWFTEGQVYRSHFNGSSALNDLYTVRAGAFVVPGNDCPHSGTRTPQCPEIQKRIFPDGPNWPAN